EGRPVEADDVGHLQTGTCRHGGLGGDRGGRQGGLLAADGLSTAALAPPAGGAGTGGLRGRGTPLPRCSGLVGKTASGKGLSHNSPTPNDIQTVSPRVTSCHTCHGRLAPRRPTAQAGPEIGVRSVARGAARRTSTVAAPSATSRRASSTLLRTPGPRYGVRS